MRSQRYLPPTSYGATVAKWKRTQNEKSSPERRSGKHMTTASATRTWLRLSVWRPIPSAASPRWVSSEPTRLSRLLTGWSRTTAFPRIARPQDTQSRCARLPEPQAATLDLPANLPHPRKLPQRKPLARRPHHLPRPPQILRQPTRARRLPPQRPQRAHGPLGHRDDPLLLRPGRPLRHAQMG